MSMRFAVTVISVLTTAAHVCRVGGSVLRERAVRRLGRFGTDSGMSTAEYAVGTIAACAFAAVLYQVVTGDSIVSALRDLIESALTSLS